jgi:hypothetical protein
MDAAQDPVVSVVQEPTPVPLKEKSTASPAPKPLTWALVDDPGPPVAGDKASVEVKVNEAVPHRKELRAKSWA